MRRLPTGRPRGLAVVAIPEMLRRDNATYIDRMRESSSRRDSRNAEAGGWLRLAG